MRHKKTWVIVANGHTARLFEMPARYSPLVPLEDHVWSAPDVNEYSDSRGMSHSSIGTSQRRMSPRTGPDQLALEAFARVISDELDDALKKKRFERLVLAAAPGLMGYLRQQLDTTVKATIWVEIDKDFTHLPLDKLFEVLESHLFT